MVNSTPGYEVVMANGGRTFGGFSLPVAVQAARDAEVGSGISVVRIVQGANIVLEGEGLSRALG